MKMNQAKKPSFHLSKWYLDCISDEGETAIGYSARLSWKALALSYNGYLKFGGAHEEHTQKTSLINCAQPELSSDGILWNSKGLSCRGAWRPRGNTTLSPVTLFENSTGFVKWHCMQPLSDVQIDIKGKTCAGLGYVEQLEMSLAPWELPLKELHWGRFLSPDNYLVWIEWRGPYPLTLVYLNGEKIENADISSSHVAWENGRLEINDKAVLRQGPFVKTALAKIPGVRSIFPEQILLINECKWRSRGRLLHQGEEHTGWVIHEIVQFG